MSKLIAIINVVSWAGFWAFGYIALTTHTAQTGQIITAGIIAFVALIVGFFAYLWLARRAEETGYAPRRNRAVRFEEDDMTGEG